MPTVSYRAKITNAYRILDGTVRYYRDAVRYIVGILMDKKRYALLSGITGQYASHTRMLHIEHWIHGTSKNKPAFSEFDRRFYKFPSYLRRSAIMDAFGIVDGYQKLLRLWKDSGCTGRRPRLNPNQSKMPCFYNGNMYICHSDDPDYIYKGDEEEWNLKVWHSHDWVFIPVVLRRTDVKYIRENCSGMKCSAPVLEKHDKNYYLRFTFTWKSDRKFVKDRAVERAVGVDLGINTDAVCSLVLKNGTVAAREFIDSPAEKDRLYKDLRLIRRSQKHGNFHNPRLWRFVNHYNDAVETAAARKIVAFAVKYDAGVIVFEHLNMRGRKLHGSRAQRITMWRKNAIQNRVAEMAARLWHPHDAYLRPEYICSCVRWLRVCYP